MLVFRSGWNYGIKDVYGVLDIKLLINWEFAGGIFGIEKGLDIIVNGEK